MPSERERVCVYCGATVRTQAWKAEPVTCACHRDLPERDPHFLQVDQWAPARGEKGSRQNPITQADLPRTVHANETVWLAVAAR
jgi:hypothetical protein